MAESSVGEEESMEKGLLGKERNGFFGEIFDEVKLLGYIAGPMVTVTLSQYFLQVISIMMVGHLGELVLSSTAITISFCAVTGFSVIYGMASALETLSGQAYGAKQYRRLGIQTNTAILTLTLVCIPLSLMWSYLEKILVFMGQNPLISREAGKFSLWLIPALFAYAILQPLIRYFQTQSIIYPLLLSSCASICCHIPLCWALVFKSRLGHFGAALSIGISYWLNVSLLVLYMKFSPACESTRVSIFSNLFQGFGEFLWFAIPSSFMICLEWWSFELLTLLSGFLPNPQLETSVLSVCLSTLITLFTIPEGLGAAASTRVSNELGAGKPRAARFAVHVVMSLAVLEALIVSSALFLGRNAFGYVFSNEKEVVHYVTNMAPLVCATVILNCLHGVLSGIARGCGWQDLGAFVNLGSYYLFGIPVAAALGFWLNMRGKGLWIGIFSGCLLQTCLLSVITICINWEKQAIMARKRIFEEKSVEDNNGLSEHSSLY
ncbi:protein DETOXIFICATION 14-like [Humulus lupulus]|uniref:protein DETOXIFICATION 14-like n=1 Tax=Humulus lupulus TaxID=3486 RepID=UPI002B418498|nr:protein DETOXIFICATION 14-like [Humulus lupulus]